MDDLVVFTHVFRTGGMAAYEYLKSAGVRVGRPTYEEIVAYQSQWRQYDILVVHAPFGIDYFIPGRPVKYVTFLREPHDRIISRYFSGQDPKATWATMLESFRGGQFFAPDNMMTRFLRNHSDTSMKKGFWETIERPLHWAGFEEAKFNLEHQYFFVGLTEWWEESMRWLCRSFDWPLPYGRAKEDNASKHRPRDRRLPDEIMEALYRREVLDGHLYWFGRELATDYLFR